MIHGASSRRVSLCVMLFGMSQEHTKNNLTEPIADGLLGDAIDAEIEPTKLRAGENSHRPLAEPNGCW